MYRIENNQKYLQKERSIILMLFISPWLVPELHNPPDKHSDTILNIVQIRKELGAKPDSSYDKTRAETLHVSTFTGVNTFTAGSC